jgi:adenosylcobinamide kinase/adenosylcobinamide-phosphate guanylyltransferase
MSADVPAAGSPRQACLLATALAGDAEMAQRIARHRSDRALRVPGLLTVEVGGVGAGPPALGLTPQASLAEALRAASAPHRLLVIDCLTLWLTQLALPLQGPPASAEALAVAVDDLVHAVQQARGPVVLVSNEIGLGVSPLSAEARRFIDLQGGLHQQLAAVCERVTLMVAGCALAIKREAS